MHGDFSRVTYDRRRHLSRVLAQQGMVTLDADDNERAAVQLAQVRAAVRDLLGPHGTVAHAVRGVPAPVGGDGFSLVQHPAAPWDFLIEPGRYWVDGVPCELEAAEDVYVPPTHGRVDDGAPATDPPRRDPVSYLHQPDHPAPPALAVNGDYLAYLEVWERHLTSADDPAVREVALGADTAGRARVVWQVKVLAVDPDDVHKPSGALLRPAEELLPPRSDTKLAARAWRAADADDDECALAAEPQFRGPENQLYRVEIHDPSKGRTTWKWSRDNGSVTYPLAGEPNGAAVLLEHLGFDDRTALKDGALLEAVSDRSELQQDPAPLLLAQSVDSYTREVTLAPAEKNGEVRTEGARYLRRWDHTPLTGDAAKGLGGALPVAAMWRPLEDGVQIWLALGATVRSGDHWLIPARSATGDVEWPRVGARPLAVPPHGVERWFAPLARIATGNGGVEKLSDLRRVLTQTLR